ncbi:MAG TPA: heparinase II/III family protein [Xanthobacteraceae bacterium]|nr:heparinase II/III family protein [Xanthobacteraceae bacterium]
MSRALIADRLRLSWLLLRRGAHHLVARILTNRFLRLPLPGKAERLVIAPQDLRTADPTRASEIYAGRFAFAGKIVVCDGRSPFEMVPPSDEWAEVLLGFGWLRHLRAADANITRANARALVDEWITLVGSWDAFAWRPEILARRTISWLTHAPVILDDADVRFYRRFLRNLTRQVRYLRLTACTTRAGVPRLQARIALAYAALCMAGQIRHLRKATAALVEEIERQILPDGGHITRNPAALIELLLDLLPLSQAYTARNVSPPGALLNAIDRMMPMLRFFRHTEGTFALFNGMGPTPPDLLATILAYDDARGTPVNNAPYSGYQRIENGGSVLLMDTGYAPPVDMSAEAHAGCLSFELSSKLQRIVVNCGLPATGRESWRHVARATAAHSTVTFNDTSSCRFLSAGPFRRMFGTSMVGGPGTITVTREERDKTVTLRTSHDGYAERFGVIHHRTLVLASDGNRLDGEDLFLPAKGNFLPSTALDEFAVRFHLHPAIRANRLTDGHSVMLMLPNKDVWTFNAHEDEVEIEESVYLAGPDGPRRTVQIVIYGHARKVPRVYWTFIHVPQLPTGGRRGRGQEPEAPA